MGYWTCSECSDVPTDQAKAPNGWCAVGQHLVNNTIYFISKNELVINKKVKEEAPKMATLEDFL